MISIVLLLSFFYNKWYCLHCLYNVVIIVVENKFQFNSIYGWIRITNAQATNTFFICNFRLSRCAHIKKEVNLAQVHKNSANSITRTFSHASPISITHTHTRYHAHNILHTTYIGPTRAHARTHVRTHARTHARTQRAHTCTTYYTRRI